MFLNVAAGILQDAAGRVLIAERPAGKHMAGSWEFPGGKIAAGETALQGLVRRMPISRHVVKYAVALARATRPNTPDATDYTRQYVTWGAGPRASQYLLLGAKALAVLDGQPTVSAQHVREVAPLVLRHRILPNYQATGEGITSADIVEQIVRTMAEPVYAQ